MLTRFGKSLFRSNRRTYRAAAPLASGLSTWTKSDDQALTEMQHNLLLSYLQTGSGSEDLFGSINQKSNGNLSKAEVAFFLSHASQDCEVSPKMLENLDGLADDHPISLAEFQQWLDDATKKDDDDVNGNYNWNAGNMNQKLRQVRTLRIYKRATVSQY